MASEKITDHNATQPNAGDRLRGGTQGGEQARLIGPDNKEGGTPDIASPRGEAHPPKPSQARPNTDIGEV